MSDAAKEKEDPKKQKTPFSVRFAFFMLFVSAVVFLPSTIVLFVCMIPALVASIVDNHPKKTAWLTVGAMNMAGTVPAWLTLIDMGHTPLAAFQLVVQPVTLLVAYGAAAVGWLIYQNVTPLIAGIVLNRNERRIREIDQQQKALIKKWGPEVSKE